MCYVLYREGKCYVLCAMLMRPDALAAMEDVKCQVSSARLMRPHMLFSCLLKFSCIERSSVADLGELIII